MTDKERLECIKERHEVANVNYHAKNFAEMKVILEQLFLEEDTDWLIEQAERVQELEGNLDDVSAWNHGHRAHIHKLKRQNKRYREALGELRSRAMNFPFERDEDGSFIEDAESRFLYEFCSQALEESK